MALGNISTSAGISLSNNVSVNSNGITFQPTDSIINSVVVNSGGKTKDQIKGGYYVFVVALKKLSNGQTAEVARGKSGTFTITAPVVTIIRPS